MTDTELDSRMPVPTLAAWLRSVQAVYDEGGASKDRRPELAAVLIESQQKEIASLTSQLEELRIQNARIPKLEMAFLEAAFTNEEKDRLTKAIEKARATAIEECAKVVQARADRYRERASETADLDLSEQRTFGAEACEWAVADIRALGGQK